MDPDQIEIDQVVDAPYLPESAVVKKVEQRENHTLLEVLTEESKDYHQKFLTDEELDDLDIVQSHQFNLAENSKEFFYLIEANRIRMAHQFDPMLAVNVSQVDPLPHQIEAVYDYILDRPKVRFLLADDPGAGKTIMAGLTLRELQQRHLVDRCLIVSPGHLQEQWQREMDDKFRLQFTKITRDQMRASPFENVWEEHDHCVTSLDFAKQDDVMKSLSNVQWDLVIVDEAHKMAAYQYSEDGDIDKTQRYKLGELLTDNTFHMLFTTATPHKGDEQNFRLFLELLKPGMFSNLDIVEDTIQDKQNTIFLRRLKEDLRNLKGEKIFPPRHVQTVRFSMTNEEKKLYNEVTSYVRDYFDKAKDNRHVTFAMMMLQKRLCSSVESVYQSLKRRRSKLENILDYPEEIAGNPEFKRIKRLSEDELEEEYSDMSEQERKEIEDKMEKLTYAENIEQVEEEIDQLEMLIEQAERTAENKIESKLQKLRNEILDNLGDEKLLIFTEFTDTLEYLSDMLRSWGYSVTNIHGGMTLEERIDAEEEFKHESQIMVATEAAGEGINLQFCSWMVNYDIPWNPNRLEQRMGRVHRYGQEYDVYIFNMITEDTMEGQVLDRLFDKLDRMKEHLGSDQVFDVIGELFSDEDLSGLMEEAITEQRNIEDITDDLEEVDEDKLKQQFEQIMMKGLATEHIDTVSVQERQTKAQENRLVPEYIEEYFFEVFDELEGKYTDRADYYTIKKVPYELRKIGKTTEFKNNYGKVRKNYKKVVFDKNKAHDASYEFVAPGHPLLEAVNEYVLHEMGMNAQQFSMFADPDNEREGVIWFVQGEVRDGSGKPAGKRIFSLYEGRGCEFHKVNPSVLWDLKPVEDGEIPEGLKQLANDSSLVDEYVMEEMLKPYKNEVQEKRNRTADIKEKYGIRSLDNQILELENDNIDFQQRVQDGEKNLKGQITKNKRKIEELEEKRNRLEDEIENERNLTISAPEIVGATFVVPLEQTRTADSEGGMHRNDEIEAVGMTEAEQYEKSEGRFPQDVAEENLGFDIRSWNEPEGEEERVVSRYIEVKARAGVGKISLTPNEWMKAQRFEDQYWLYIVSNASTNSPEIETIQNPTKVFDPEEIVEVKRYIIPETKWSNQSD